MALKGPETMGWDSNFQTPHANIYIRISKNSLMILILVMNVCSAPFFVFQLPFLIP